MVSDESWWYKRTDATYTLIGVLIAFGGFAIILLGYFFKENIILNFGIGQSILGISIMGYDLLFSKKDKTERSEDATKGSMK